MVSCPLAGSGSVLKLTDLAQDAVREFQRAGCGVVLPAVPGEASAYPHFLADVVEEDLPIVSGPRSVISA